MRNITPVVNISRTNIHYDGKKQKSRRRIKTTPLQILDHALPYLLLWQSPMHCAVRCIFTYALGGFGKTLEGTGTGRLYHEAAPKRIIGMPAAKRVHPL